jgi:hypothetical protein
MSLAKLREVERIADRVLNAKAGEDAEGVIQKQAVLELIKSVCTGTNGYNFQEMNKLVHPLLYTRGYLYQIWSKRQDYNVTISMFFKFDAVDGGFNVTFAHENNQYRDDITFMPVDWAQSPESILKYQKSWLTYFRSVCQYDKAKLYAGFALQKGH